MDHFTIQEIDAFVVHAPIEEPVLTSFGVMKGRSAVLIRVVEDSGITGWGEAWCNFPACGAEYRGRLLETEIAPKLIGKQIDNPETAFNQLTKELRALCNQSGEYGPIAQVVAGVDVALWDIAAQKANQPLWRLLGGVSNRVPIYASGINPTDPKPIVECKISEGYRAFKLKIGFDPDLDHGNLNEIRKLIGPTKYLMADANQAWNLEEARRLIPSLAHTDLLWIEEPIPADATAKEWKELSDSSPIPIAIGENLRNQSAFNWAIESRIFDFIQPDVGKWGGISGCSIIAKQSVNEGISFCPHSLGSEVSLLASAHLLASVGGNGHLEVDANPNPLRDLFHETPLIPVNGEFHLDESPGLGRAPRLDVLARYS